MNVDALKDEPVLSWALVATFVQAVITLLDVTIWQHADPVVLGAIHGVALSGIALVGAILVRSKVWSQRTVEAAMVAGQQTVDQLHGQVVSLTERLEQPVDDGLGALNRNQLASLAKLANATTMTGWTEQQLRDSLRQQGVRVTRAAA